MKKTIIAVALLGSLGFVGAASAEISASQTFTWSGTVPAKPTSKGWVIAAPTGAPIGNGILTFTTDIESKGELTGSTALRFNVFKELTSGVANPDEPAASYNYSLISLAVNSSGLAQEQDADGYYAIQSNNGGVVKPMVKNSSFDGAAGETILNVIKSSADTPSNQPMAGDSVEVQASIVVEGAV
ncbi:hypothetical protein ACEUDK_19415 [Aeromonas veronii]